MLGWYKKGYLRVDGLIFSQIRSAADYLNVLRAHEIVVSRFNVHCLGSWLV